MIVQSDSTNFHLFLLLLSSHTNCGSLFLVYLCEFCSVGADFEWIWLPVLSSSNSALQLLFSDVFFMGFITPKFVVSIWRLSNYLHYSHFFSASFDVSGLIFCAIERSILPRHFLLFVLFWQLDHEFHLSKYLRFFFRRLIRFRMSFSALHFPAQDVLVFSALMVFPWCAWAAHVRRRVVCAPLSWRCCFSDFSFHTLQFGCWFSPLPCSWLARCCYAVWRLFCLPWLAFYLCLFTINWSQSCKKKKKKNFTRILLQRKGIF